MSHIQDEADLLSRSRRFDRSALAEIYDCYSQGLFAYAIRLLGEDALAKDCVAETFSRFLQALKAGKGPNDHLKAYLYRIAHNWISDQFRRQPPQVGLEEHLSEDGPGLEQIAAQRILRQEMRAALVRLTPEQRQVIVLKYIEGWENEAIASALQKPVGAVKSLQHRALDALRRRLAASEEVHHGT